MFRRSSFFAAVAAGIVGAFVVFSPGTANATVVQSCGNIDFSDKNGGGVFVISARGRSNGCRADCRAAANQQSLRPERINDLQKRELIKIRIAGADPPNAVLAHENCRMRVMQQITGEMRQLYDNLAGNVGMPVRGNEDGEAWRSKESRYEFPRR